MNANKKDIVDMIMEIDEDGNGQMDYEEFLELINGLRKC